MYVGLLSSDRMATTEASIRHYVVTESKISATKRRRMHANLTSRLSGLISGPFSAVTEVALAPCQTAD